MELTKDDEFEIEKCLDIQCGWISERIIKACQVATNMGALQKSTTQIDKIIKELTETRENYGRISKKFEDKRKGEINGKFS